VREVRLSKKGASIGSRIEVTSRVPKSEAIAID
jgi:hypothetical protein